MSAQHTPGPLWDALLEAARLVDQRIYEWGGQVSNRDNTAEEDRLLEASYALSDALAAVSCSHRGSKNFHQPTER